MPIYEYACNKCGHVFDVLQKISDPAPGECPACGAPDVRRLLSAPSFRLKGGGWYETDFKSANKRNIAGDGEAKPKDDKGGGDKTADKPAADKPAADKPAAAKPKAASTGDGD